MFSNSRFLLVNSGMIALGVFPPPTPTNLLLKASTNGDQETARRILEADQISINVRNVLGGTPLHLAVDYEHPELVEYYLSQGAKVNTQNTYGETPLHAACLRGNARIVNLLLKSGAGMENRDEQGQLPIHVAARKNRAEAIELLLRHGFVDVNARDLHGNTPLLLLRILDSCYCRNVAALLNRGADLNIGNKDGKMLIIRCCWECDCPVIKHVRKLRLLRYDINWLTLDTVPRHVDLDKGVEVFQNELESLKKMSISVCPKKSLYDCLYLSRDEASVYVENETFRDIYQRNGGDFRQEFPHYGFLLNLIYERGKTRRMIRDRAKDLLENLIATRLPEKLSEEILGYMNESELRKFCNRSGNWRKN